MQWTKPFLETTVCQQLQSGITKLLSAGCIKSPLETTPSWWIITASFSFFLHCSLGFRLRFGEMVFFTAGHTPCSCDGWMLHGPFFVWMNRFDLSDGFEESVRMDLKSTQFYSRLWYFQICRITNPLLLADKKCRSPHPTMIRWILFLVATVMPDLINLYV